MKIICLGDSITVGAGVPHSLSWVGILSAETAHTWINAGIPGDTTVGMLARLQTQVLPQAPDYVLCLGGLNDILLTESADQAKCAMMGVVSQCAAAGVRPVVGIPYEVSGLSSPWKELCDPQAAAAALREYIRWLRRITQALFWRTVDFSCAGAQLLSDGVHLNVQGHRMAAEAVLRSGYF